MFTLKKTSGRYTSSLLKPFENEDIYFSEVLIDKTFPSENAPTESLIPDYFTRYINNPEYDLQNSYVIGDRITDVKLAKT